MYNKQDLEIRMSNIEEFITFFQDKNQRFFNISWVDPI